jgi:hypothetical protein
MTDLQTTKKCLKQEKMRQAAETMDRLAEKTDPAWSGSNTVKQWRRRDEPSTEEVSPEETAEIKALRDEAQRGETVPWSRVKAKAQKLLE